jgi:hypothetical protein
MHEKTRDNPAGERRRIVGTEGNKYRRRSAIGRVLASIGAAEFDAPAQEQDAIGSIPGRPEPARLCARVK